MDRIQLYHEDCQQTLQRLGDRSVDLLLQDPPYGVTRNTWDRKPVLATLWPQWKRVIKPHGAMIFFSQQPFTSDLLLSCPELFRYDLIWYKPLGSGFLSAKRMPLRNHEHILLFYFKLPVYNPIMGVGIRKRGKRSGKHRSDNYGEFSKKMPTTFDDEGKRYPQSVIEFTNGNRKNFHPTQKPVELMRYLIQTYSNDDDLVFDGYFGSGTTPVACVMENRRFVGSEMDQRFYHHAVNRVREAQNSRGLF